MLMVALIRKDTSTWRRNQRGFRLAAVFPVPSVLALEQHVVIGAVRNSSCSYLTRYRRDSACGDKRSAAEIDVDGLWREA
jgi:hypothetical protein